MLLTPNQPPAIVSPAAPVQVAASAGAAVSARMAATVPAPTRANALASGRGVELDALAKTGEAKFLGPGGTPRLVPIAPMRPGAPVMVFVHGIGGDPTNQEILIREAQARGNQVYVMAYDTYGTGGSANARGFEDQFRQLAAGGTRDVTIVAHSLGALTTKAALDAMTGSDGHLQGFAHVRYFALSAPWGGVNVADASLKLLTQQQRLAFARDLAPDSAYWKKLVARPLPGEVDFYNVQGSSDQFTALAWGKARRGDLAAVLAASKRSITLPGGTHNSAMWDPRAAAFIFDPAHAPDPATVPGPGRATTIAREVQACAGQRKAFQARPGDWLPPPAASVTRASRAPGH